LINGQTRSFVTKLSVYFPWKYCYVTIRLQLPGFFWSLRRNILDAAGRVTILSLPAECSVGSSQKLMMRSLVWTEPPTRTSTCPSHSTQWRVNISSASPMQVMVKCRCSNLVRSPYEAMTHEHEPSRQSCRSPIHQWLVRVLALVSSIVTHASDGAALFVWLISISQQYFSLRTNQQLASSTFLSQQISTSHQPPAKRTSWTAGGKCV
jgi:hypothetical protein